MTPVNCGVPQGTKWPHGTVGYDLGRRVADGVYETRWMGRVIWGQIFFGLALLGYGFYCYRKIRRANGTETPGRSQMPP